MQEITVSTWDGEIKTKGECLSRELVWSRNVEERTHLNAGLHTTKQVPTDYYQETWLINGKEIKLHNYETAAGVSYQLDTSDFDVDDYDGPNALIAAMKN